LNKAKSTYNTKGSQVPESEAMGPLLEE